MLRVESLTKSFDGFLAVNGARLNVGTGEVVAELSELLRYSLRSGAGLVTLKDELDIIRSYMTIQRYRFVGKIRWAEDIDENLLDTQIPGMILQPLVENAVKHGLEPIERTGTVTLKVERVGSGIHVSIRDDGVGIGDAALYLLDSEAGSSDSLGLRNVKRRLIIHYGVDVLTIRRPQSGGTECLISIPVDD